MNGLIWTHTYQTNCLQANKLNSVELFAPSQGV